jgi:uncharacterized protein YecE (DUF72 family)
MMKSFNELRKMNIPLCTIDQPKFGEVFPFEPVVTADRAYFRFHGRNWTAWKDSVVVNHGKEQTYDQQSERYKYLYTPGRTCPDSAEDSKLSSGVR